MENKIDCLNIGIHQENDTVEIIIYINDKTYFRLYKSENGELSYEYDNDYTDIDEELILPLKLYLHQIIQVDYKSQIERIIDAYKGF